MLQPDPLLWQAIERKRMIRAVYHGKERVVEPHDHGVLNGSVQLLGYQIAGSSSRRLPNWILMKVEGMAGLELHLPNWILMKVEGMAGLELLEQRFPGGRPTPSRNHLQWDILFIRVRAAD